MIIVTGIILRTDKLGVSSIIRSLHLKPESYDPMIHFFRAESWDLEDVQNSWCKVLKSEAELFRTAGRITLVGDGVKQSKEGHYMPGVKRLAQESETQTKPEMIHGHMWGCIGILIGDEDHLACTPVSMRLHDGLQAMQAWKNSGISDKTHVVQMIQNACQTAQNFGDAYCLMDRYFLSIDSLEELESQNKANAFRVDLITKAKCSAVAYQFPEPPKPGQRGRPRKKGEKVKLMELFDTHREEFKSVTVSMYGKKQHIRYYCVNLLWGQGRYQPLRFVLVEYNKTRSILVSTDLLLDPIAIIEAYCRRFRIETTFREFKQEIGGMAYHFWTTALPRLNHFRKKSDPEPLKEVHSDSAKRRILNTVRATERYVLVACIAMGILHILSINPEMNFLPGSFRYQRTPAKAKPSEANVMFCLRQSFFAFCLLRPKNLIPNIIADLQSDALYSCDIA